MLVGAPRHGRVRLADPPYALGRVAGGARGARARGDAARIRRRADSERFSAALTLGYETTYLFRGVAVGDHAPWASVDLAYAPFEDFSFRIGALFMNPTQGHRDADELDLYALATGNFGAFSISLAATWFHFTERGTNAEEVGIVVVRSFDSLDLSAGYFYDLTIEGHYFETALAHTLELTQQLRLRTSAGVSFARDYYGVSGGDHVSASATLSRALTEALTLEAYLALNLPFDDRNRLGERERVHGGLRASVAF